MAQIQAAPNFANLLHSPGPEPNDRQADCM